jgi:hypothetical protein
MRSHLVCSDGTYLFLWKQIVGVIFVAVTQGVCLSGLVIHLSIRFE